MLPNLRFSRYRFAYSVQEPLKMPEFKGNVFRGRLGYILRQITCVGNVGDCEKRCDFPDRCVYSRCFEPPVPSDSPILRNQPFAPHPFVLEPPRTRKLDYAPGDAFACNLILVGEAIDLLPWLVYAFNEVGQRRIGLRGERGRCKLETVESLPVRGEGRTIYTAETEMLTDAGVILDVADVMADAPDIANLMELEFLAPTSIKIDGEWARSLTFDHLIRNLLRRVRFLSVFHCGEDLDAETRALVQLAASVKHISRLRWVKKERWSHRTERAIPMGGFVGKIRYRGDLAPFLPIILLGERLHIGHHTAFGYGQYRVNEVKEEAVEV